MPGRTGHPTVISCGVCSQFFSTLSFFIRSLLHSLQEILPGVEAMEDEVNERIHRMDDHVIPIINRGLRKAARTAVIFGNQYIFRTEKAIQKLTPIERYYLCGPEREDCRKALNDRGNEIDTKLKLAKREFKTDRLKSLVYYCNGCW